MNIEDSFLGKPVGVALETLDIDAGKLEQYVYAISLQNRLTEESVQGLNSLIETIKSAGAKLSDILELPIVELNKVVEKVKKSRKKRVVALGAVFVTAIGITSAQAEGIDFDKIIDGQTNASIAEQPTKSGNSFDIGGVSVGTISIEVVDLSGVNNMSAKNADRKIPPLVEGDTLPLGVTHKYSGPAKSISSTPSKKSVGSIEVE